MNAMNAIVSVINLHYRSSRERRVPKHMASIQGESQNILQYTRRVPKHIAVYEESRKTYCSIQGESQTQSLVGRVMGGYLTPVSIGFVIR